MKWIRNKNGYYGEESPLGQFWVRQEFKTLLWYWDINFRRSDTITYHDVQSAMDAAEKWAATTATYYGLASNPNQPARAGGTMYTPKTDEAYRKLVYQQLHPDRLFSSATVQDLLADLVHAEAHLLEALEALKAKKTWRCFHCNEIFTNPEHAAEHFGMNEGSTVACKLSHSEGHLVTLVRKLQRELASYRREDNLVLRAWLTREADHRQQLVREEEKGYARGIADMKKMAPYHHDGGIRVIDGQYCSANNSEGI